MKVLVVEDDPDIASLLLRNFKSEGFDAVHAPTGEEALETVRGSKFQVIVLDVMLPGRSGIEVCETLRKRNNDATIIMLSARDAVNDRIDGLSAGADDYVVKPFAFEELLARIQAQQRRRQQAEPDSGSSLVAAGRLSYDPDIREVRFETNSTTLTDREADLLVYLMRSEGTPLSRETIFDALWHAQGGVALNVVDVYIGYLRRKLGTLSPEARAAVRTVRGKGFMFSAP
jgi:DNA-binding response OmpR family regulator